MNLIYLFTLNQYLFYYLINLVKVFIAYWIVQLIIPYLTIFTNVENKDDMGICLEKWLEAKFDEILKFDVRY